MLTNEDRLRQWKTMGKQLQALNRATFADIFNSVNHVIVQENKLRSIPLRDWDLIATSAWEDAASSPTKANREKLKLVSRYVMERRSQKDQGGEVE